MTEELETVEACQEAMSSAVRAHDWPAYFAARHRWASLENEEVAAQPPPEHTTRDPWPEGFPVPSGAAGLKKRAEAAGWEARAGYMRAWRKGVGRGVYRLHHYVVIQARLEGRNVWARWRSPVVEGKLSWAFDAGNVNGWPADTLTMVNDAVAATVSGS